MSYINLMARLHWRFLLRFQIDGPLQRLILRKIAKKKGHFQGHIYINCCYSSGDFFLNMHAKYKIIVLEGL